MTATKSTRKPRASTKTKAAAKTAANDPAETQTKKAASKKKEARPGLFIGTRRGVARFRRAGFVFSREPYGIALEALTEEQIEQLKAEPSLVVEEVDFDVEGEQV